MSEGTKSVLVVAAIVLFFVAAWYVANEIGTSAMESYLSQS